MQNHRRHFTAVWVALLLAAPGIGTAQSTTVDFLDGFAYTGRGQVASVGAPAVPQLVAPVTFPSHDGSATLFGGIENGAFAVYRRETAQMVLLGSFGPAPAASLSLAVGHFDGGDDLDVLALDPGRAIYVWTNDGTDGFTLDRRVGRAPGQALTHATTVPTLPASSPDAVLLWGPSTTAGLWIDDPMGGTVEPIPVRFMFPPTSVTAGDIDGDGVTDLVLASSSNDRLLLLVGPPPNWRSYPFSVGDAPSSVTIVQSAVDPYADLLVTNAADGTISSLVQEGATRYNFRHASGSPLHVGTWPTDAVRVGNTDEFLVHQADSSLPVSVSLASGSGDLRFVGAGPYVPGRVLGITTPGATGAILVPEINRIATLCGEGPAILQALVADLDLAILLTPTSAVGCMIAELRRSSAFTDAEPDWILRTTLVAANPVPDWISDDLDLGQAHGITVGDPSIVVAVLDSGIEGNMLIAVNENEVEDGIDNDGNGVIDDIDGFDYVGGRWGTGVDQDLFISGTTALEDSVPSLHGTVVAGAVVGVAPNISMMPVKVLDADRQSSVSVVALGLRYAALRGADVATMSLAGPNESVTLASAVTFARSRGLVLIGASGNDGDPRAVGYPSLIDEVIAVAAHERPIDNQEPALWSGSNRGTGVELSAPGADICIANVGCHTGTSMAAPLVSGAVALMLSVEPDLDSCVVRSILRETAVDAGPPGYDLERGFGRLNVGAAVASVASYTGAPCPDRNVGPVSWRVQRRDFVTGIEPASLGGVTRVHVVLDSFTGINRGF